MSCRKWEIQILRRAQGELAPEADAGLSKHLENCKQCRVLAAKFSDLDALFPKCSRPTLPPLLPDKIIATVSEAMREDSTKGPVWTFFNFFASLRPAIAGACLALGIVIGVVSGSNLAKSVSRTPTASQHDLLSLAGLGGSEMASSLEFIWTDTNRRAGR